MRIFARRVVSDHPVTRTLKGNPRVTVWEATRESKGPMRLRAPQLALPLGYSPGSKNLENIYAYSRHHYDHSVHQDSNLKLSPSLKNPPVTSKIPQDNCFTQLVYLCAVALHWPLASLFVVKK